MANIEQKFREACVKSGLASMLNQLNNPALNSLIGATLSILKESAGGNTVTGTVKLIGRTQNVSKKDTPFNKRELVLDTSRYDPDSGEKRESCVSITFAQKHCDDLNGLAPGDKVEVAFRISGREWNMKVINDIVGYRVTRLESAKEAAAPQPAAPAPQPVAPQAPAADPFPPQEAPTQGDLPF